jgi:hypothetical protein
MIRDSRRHGGRSVRDSTWAAPILLAIVSAIGLTAALVADGVGDVIGWAALAVPVVVAAWYSRRSSG